MAAKKKNNDDFSARIAAQNRKARHNYFIEDTVECGMVLTGTEVKSLRSGRASIQEAYATEKDGELYLINANIPIYEGGNRFNHEPKRPRKLLLHRKELDKLLGMTTQKGYTLVPLHIHFNDRGIAKVAIGVGKGKQSHDKRDSIKDRDWKRDKARLMREKY
ncbi:SsrA-binding protein [Candidatus Terasakiella magnetica]|uniref:SsrA-binding protein n=1 Tax=Candidatus Terasakiella magnetica TaxID=1867952 RepID=A0A1C3RCR9_9PROT|nr:SsrA-binding protein SmpB [Candidatus Terasakiella magnetica]SCA55079.1 SsrA-binding protein [Candidatus Terasakiella magnetica]